VFVLRSTPNTPIRSWGQDVEFLMFKRLVHRTTAGP